MPALEFLNALRQGEWLDDPDAASLPSDAQIADHHWFRSALDHLAETGEPQYAHAVNYLQDGIWELKRGAKRLSWYDTDGAGSYEAKAKITDSAYGTDSDYWWFPNFDPNLRAGHCFPKTGQTTDAPDIEETLRVRQEDLAHDGDE